MKKVTNRSGRLGIIAAFFGFFIMGFIDVVGIATNYIKNDFSLSSTMANFIPMMVFIWFFAISIPASILMGKVGRRGTALLSLALTTVAMLIPYFFYNYYLVLVAFALLGISNTVLQVALNPLVASMFNKEKTASLLTMGQFIKAIASFLGPIVAGVAASTLGDWKFIFLIFACTSLLSVLLLLPAKVNEVGLESTTATFGGAVSLLKHKTVLFCFLCIFLTVGFDVGMNVSIPEILMRRAGLSLEKASYGNSVYFAAKTIGAFLGALLLLKMKPMKYLIISLVVALVAFSMLMYVTNAWALYGLIFIASFACANIFSIMFSFALQAMPSHANEVSALMVMAIVGGAAIPFIQGLINDSLGLFAALLIIPVCLLIILFITLNLRKHVPR